MKKEILTAILLLPILSAFSQGQVIHFDSLGQKKDYSISVNFSEKQSKQQLGLLIKDVSPADSSNLYIKVNNIDTVRGRYHLQDQTIEYPWDAIQSLLNNKAGEIAIYLKPQRNARLKISVNLGENDDQKNAEKRQLIEAACEQYVKSKFRKYKRNRFYQDGDDILLFFNHYGELIGNGWPTVARDDYQFKIIWVRAINSGEQDFQLKVRYEGDYDPQLYVRGLDDLQKEPKDGRGDDSNGNALSVDNEEWVPQIQSRELITVGPFSDHAKFTIEKVEAGKSELLHEQTINIARTYWVSISSGLYSTGLRNPQNVETFVKANGDTTLIADDPQGRGVATIMATFYLGPRSLVSTPVGWERVGLSVGTQLNKNQFQNFFLGASYEVQPSLNFTAGVHYGRRTAIAGNEDFEFGEDVFLNSTMKVKQVWGVAPFVGVNIDLNIFTRLFGTQL